MSRHTTMTGGARSAANVLVLSSLVSLSCQGQIGGGGGASEGPTSCEGTPATAETQRVFEALKPACEGCHSTGTRPYFASVSAFQSLVVADPRLVAPGRADESELVRLLEGKGTGSFKQMPIAGASYAGLVGEGKATASMSDIRKWIAALPAQRRDATPDRDAPRIVRLNARQIHRTLYQQLGLAQGDFFTGAADYGYVMAEAIDEDRYPLQGPDDFPAPRQLLTAERYLGLGGGSIVSQVQPSSATSPTFVNTLTQVAQAWCRLAVEKPGNKALFPKGGATSVEAAEVMPTLKRWHTHFLAEQPSDAEVAALYDALFVPLAKEGSVVAYTGVCSYFIRHPRWIFH